MWFKKFRQKKLQSVIIVLIVALCCALMCSSLTIMFSWGAPYAELSDEVNAADLRVYVKVPGLEAAEEICKNFNALDETENAIALKSVYLGQKLTANGNECEGFYDITAYDERVHKNVRILSGEMNLENNGCAVPAVIANKYEIEVGDKLVLAGEDYTVSCIYTDPYSMSVAFDVQLLTKETPDSLSSRYLIYVWAKDGISANELVDAYKRAHDGTLGGHSTSLQAQISNCQMTEQIFGAILLAMSILVLVVGAVMIRYLIKNALLHDKKSIAIYKTIGYKNRWINGIYIVFYLVLVFVGALIGAALSPLISNSFTATTFKNLGVTGSNSGLLVEIICVAVVTLFVLFQIWLLIRKSKNVRPIETLRGEAKVAVKNKKPRKTAGFSSFAMARRMLTREKKNTVIIIITCFLAIYCVNFGVTAVNLITEMDQLNYYWIGFDKHDVSVEAIGESDISDLAVELETLPEVKKAVLNTTNVYTALKWEEGVGDTNLSTMTYKTYDGIEMGVLQGRNPKYDNEIAIGSAIAKELGKTVGDYITIYFNGTEEATLLICGTFQSFYSMGRSARILEATALKYGSPVDYSDISIYLNEGEDIDSFVDNYASKYSDIAAVFPRTDKYTSILTMINGPQMVAIKPFIALILILGAVNIIAIIYLKNKDNCRTNSIYKAIGYSSGHLLRANIIYVAIIGAVTLAICIPTFIICFPQTMVIAMSFLGFEEYPVSYDALSLIIANGATFLLFVISSVISSRGLFKNPVEDLTCE